MKLDVPYFADDTEDETHCVQAVFKMVLKHFMPDKEFSWKELDVMTGKQEGKGTWLMRGLVNLTKIGFDIVDIERFDYQRVYKEGEKYIWKALPIPIADWYINKSNLLQEKEQIPPFLEKVEVQSRDAMFSDIEQLMDDGYLVAVEINSGLLNNEDTFAAHLVLLVGYDEDNIYFHDPDPDYGADRKVSKELFKKAWSELASLGPNLTAIKLFENKGE